MSFSNRRTVDVGPIKIGGDNPLAVIAGPCVIESEGHAISVAKELKGLFQKANVPFIFKASYDKANRTSIDSFRGPGLKDGLGILKKIKHSLSVPVLSDVHSVDEVESAAEVLDIIQIPAFLCRQTDLLVAAAKTKKVINIKKGQFLAPWDMKNVLQKVLDSNNEQLMLTERGFMFGYNNMVVDYRSLVMMRDFGFPVIFDCTHSVQLPGGQGNTSGGQREFVAPLTRAAVAVGVDALFMEVHPEPDKAPSDGANMIPIDGLSDFLTEIIQLDLVRRRKSIV